MDHANPVGSWIVRVLWLIAATAAYALVLYLGPPAFLASRIVAGAVVICLILTAGVWLALKSEEKRENGLALLPILLLFGMPLWVLWSTATSTSLVIGGMLPYSDAAGYLRTITRMASGEPLGALSGQRPYFLGFFYTLFRLTGQNLQLTLAIMVWVNSVSCYFLTREVHRRLGRLAGLLVFLAVFLFYARFAGTSMTEQVGFCLGALALAFLLAGLRTESPGRLVWGIGLMAMGLLARAGAFFILPALILWIGRAMRGKRRFSYVWACVAVAVCALAFSANSMLASYYSGGEGGSYSNFTVVLYGQAVGGKGWTQFNRDHPEQSKMSRSDRQQYIKDVIARELTERPWNFVLGSLRSWAAFILPDRIGAFSYISQLNTGLRDQGMKGIGAVVVAVVGSVFTLADVVLTLAALVGLYFFVKTRAQPLSTLVLALAIGILLSAPLLPPWDSDAMRVYAVTIPAAALWATYGLVLILKKWRRFQEPQANPQAPFSGAAVLSVLLVLLVGPAVFLMGGQAGAALKKGGSGCLADEQQVILNLRPGSYIEVRPDGELSRTYLPFVRASDFRERLKGRGGRFLREEIRDGFLQLTPPYRLSYSLSTGRPKLLLTVSAPAGPAASGEPNGKCGQLVNRWMLLVNPD